MHLRRFVTVASSVRASLGAEGSGPNSTLPVAGVPSTTSLRPPSFSHARGDDDDVDNGPTWRLATGRRYETLNDASPLRQGSETSRDHRLLLPAAPRMTVATAVAAATAAGRGARRTPPRFPRDPVRYVAAEVVALLAGVLMGVSVGLISMGIAEFIGAPALVVAYSGMVVGVGVGMLTLLDMHQVSVRLYGGGGGGGGGSRSGGQEAYSAINGGAGHGGSAVQRLAVELAPLASSHGLAFRFLRVPDPHSTHAASSGGMAAEAWGAGKEFLETFRPLSPQQLSAMFRKGGSDSFGQGDG